MTRQRSVYGGSGTGSPHWEIANDRTIDGIDNENDRVVTTLSTTNTRRLTVKMSNVTIGDHSRRPAIFRLDEAKGNR